MPIALPLACQIHPILIALFFQAFAFIQIVNKQQSGKKRNKRPKDVVAGLTNK